MYPHVEHFAADYSRFQWYQNRVRRGFGPRYVNRGFSAAFARCLVGYAPPDPTYLAHKLEFESQNIPFAPYGVNWPAQRKPELEAMTFSQQARPPEAPKDPVAFVADLELGARDHSAGHHLLSGKELYEINKRYVLKLAEYVEPIPVFIYTGKWYWNDDKLLPHIDGYELEFPLWAAMYPFVDSNRKQYPIDTINPYTLDPDLDDWLLDSLLPEPWKSDSEREKKLAGWQWTSFGRGKQYDIADSDRLDQNVVYIKLGGDEPPPDPMDQVREGLEQIRRDAVRIQNKTAELQSIIP